MRFLLSALLSIAVLKLTFPLISGVNYSGSFFAALLLALITGASAWFFKSAGRALLLSLKVRSAGKASVVLLPVWLLGIWLVPALELLFFSALFPATLSFGGLSDAMAAAFPLLLVSVLTNDWSVTLKRPCDCD